MAKELPKLIATMSREIMYEDGSGPRVKVSFDSAYRLGKDDDSYVRLKGVGDDDHLVMVADIPFLIDALNEAACLDAAARRA